jgi:hypothetical protein
MTGPIAMLAAEADIRTEHAARYLARLCGHAAKMGTAGRRLGHRRPSHAPGGAPPQVRRVECAATEGTVTLDWGRWTMRALPGLLTVRAEAADEENLRRIQDLLTTRLGNLGRREHLTVAWRAGTAEARTTARPENHEAERGGSSAPVPPDCRPPGHGDGGSGK